MGPPNIYLGSTMRQVTMESGTKCWSLRSSKYVRAAIQIVEDYLDKHDQTLLTKANTPFSSNYRPELDVSNELTNTYASYFQSLISILRWIVELGRIDICLEVSTLSPQMALPCEGHLNQALHMFAYLKKYHNVEMTFDPSVPQVDASKFQCGDWSSTEFDPDIEEELPELMSCPRGVGFLTRAFVDVDHASDVITRRSRTRFIV